MIKYEVRQETDHRLLRTFDSLTEVENWWYDAITRHNDAYLRGITVSIIDDDTGELIQIINSWHW